MSIQAKSVAQTLGADILAGGRAEGQSTGLGAGRDLGVQSINLQFGVGATARREVKN